jgi:ketosteroid isomerase-like protein
MIPTSFWPKLTFAFVIVLFATTGGQTTGHLSSSQTSKSAPCSAPDFRQFDFWIGDWDAFDVGKSAIVAHARIDPILDGCVLREDYQSSTGLKGQSFSLYDPSRKIWHQSWATNRGQLLVIEGKFEAGEMILSSEDRTADGKQQRVRGTWKPMNGGVRETALISTDAGSTWQPWFDLIFRPHAQGNPTNASSDRKAVAALDTEYQAAVKINDAATMDHLLADDFALVTGSGKTYTKADLLDEARSGRIVYEHQEDTAQTVRLWGDTATVTAKLWAKGADNGKPFDYTVWFTDTYVRTPAGWRYVFGQSSLPLPKGSLSKGLNL